MTLKATKDAYFETDMNLFETKNVKNQMRCINAVTESVYGTNIKQMNNIQNKKR